MIDVTSAHVNRLQCPPARARWLRQRQQRQSPSLHTHAYPPGIIPVKAHQHIEAIHGAGFHPHCDLTTTSRSSMVSTVPPTHSTCLIPLFPTRHYSRIFSSICKNGYAIYRSPSHLPFTCLNTSVLTGLFHQLYDRMFTLYSVVLLWWRSGF